MKRFCLFSFLYVFVHLFSPAFAFGNDQSNLIGRWTMCVQDRPKEVFEVTTLLFQHDGTLTQQMRHFEGSDCSAPQYGEAFYSSIKRYQFKVTSQESGQHWIDLKLLEVLWSWDNETLAGAMKGICGVPIWEPGRFYEITGRRCRETQIPSAGKLHFDIYNISEDILRFGDKSGYYDGSTHGKRPIELDKIFRYDME